MLSFFVCTDCDTACKLFDSKLIGETLACGCSSHEGAVLKAYTLPLNPLCILEFASTAYKYARQLTDVCMVRELPVSGQGKASYRFSWSLPLDPSELKD